MRPFVKIDRPILPNGSVKTVRNYQDWRQDLINAYGPHCAYCNCKITNSGEVEHQIAQSLNVADPLDWDNLVLACKPCNNAKSKHSFTTDTHFIPTFHNTHLAFQYTVRPHGKLQNHFGCIPVPNASFPIGSVAYIKCSKTISDLKLNRVEQNAQRTKRATDTRWKNRYDVYLETNKAREMWDSLVSDLQIDLFLEDLKLRIYNVGFFSLWFNSFHDVPQVLHILINVFNQTHKESFPSDLNYQPQIRVAGDL